MPAKTCGCCGSARLAKLGEDITETLEVIPRQWKVIQTVREKFTCRDCEKITQPPAPFHPTPRGWAGPSLLAMILFEKFGQHQPLNRQSRALCPRRRRAQPFNAGRSGRGLCRRAAAAPCPDRAHVLAAERLHGDDTTVPVLAKGKTDTGRIWTYVRDDRPFGGHRTARRALLLFPRSRRRTSPAPSRGLSGLLQADAYAGYNALYQPDRPPKPITGVLCWSHARRKFFVLADIAANVRRGPNAPPISPLALAAVERIDRLFDIERAINGLSIDERLAVRQSTVGTARRRARSLDARGEPTPVQACRSRQGHELHAPPLGRLHPLPARWPCLSVEQRGRAGAARHQPSAESHGSSLVRIAAATRAAFMYTLIATAKLNDIDPQAWLADVLARIAEPARLAARELLPWNWQPTVFNRKAA